MKRQFFWGNFDFEHQLVNEVYSVQGGATPALNVCLASCWISLAEVGDAIYLPGTISPEFSSSLVNAGLPRVEFTGQLPTRELVAELQFVPWGFSTEVANVAKSKGFQFEAPLSAAIQTVNARTFSFECEQKWGGLLPGSRQLESWVELESAVIELQKLQSKQESDWVVKANFSMSARERMRGRGNQLTDQIKIWAEKRISQGQTLFLEPWVKRITEAGLQFEIPKQGDPQFIGLAHFLSDARGQYRGSRIARDQQMREEWQSVIEVGHRVAKRAQQAGYFGPLGIDAMCYLDGNGKRQYRPIQDVNARFTMGRLALGFSRFLKPSQVASWLHFPWKESYGINFSNWLRYVSESIESGTRLIATSPDQINGKIAPLVNVLVISHSVEQLRQIENNLQSAVSELAETTG